MRIVSFNVNSVRQRLHQLQSVVDKHAPDFIGLQETKVQDHEFPVTQFLRWATIFMHTRQKTHGRRCADVTLPLHLITTVFLAIWKMRKNDSLAVNINELDGR